MRSMIWAPCALATAFGALLLTSTPAAAEHTHGGKKSLAECTAFDQADKGDAAVQFTIHNTCSIPVDCAISWRVVCAPDSKKRRSTHATTVKLALTDGGTNAADASAAVCGDDGWSIDSIQWSCQPNKD